jgi:hypothetical protein
MAAKQIKRLDPQNMLKRFLSFHSHISIQTDQYELKLIFFQWIFNDFHTAQIPGTGGSFLKNSSV